MLGRNKYNTSAIMKFKIQSLMSKSNRGYSLIELLIVMVVLVTVGFIVATILVSSLRGTNKAITTETIRRNGNYTILQVSKMIEFAQNFIGVSNDNLNFSSVCPTASPTPRYNYIKIKSFDNADTTFSCFLNANAPIASNSASLVNPNEVAVTSCYFTCDRSNISQPPVIGISFTLSQKEVSSFFEKRATIPFETSVSMRNLNR